MTSDMLLALLPLVVGANALAPAPPHNLPPWSPGAAPPVPGPVFSSAFKALLVLLMIGCIGLGINLRDAIVKMRASDIGTDNELLTRGGAGNAAWLASIQKSGGRCAGELPPVPLPKAKGKKQAKKSKVKGRAAAAADDDDDDDDGEGLELEALQPSGRKKVPRPKR
uniref:Uncharacterized protein n=1 Tax=Haptolina brevifila TaxID=156173 RepID=A0A7S2HBV8_9EUKA|mmetsp:Transcript_53144/g.105661  ORF Transcript_53144/g.105661 Transcript_53144/m.105661 type:complete len:167 (+) Transcript_53144:150-650(+)|eukprot:CAMPEP_0174694848 /NCGR_PEP_ID=MMETSP1094-20130205/1347_1 /TAXON_ID=156173 /ORGANISM="Chrysochromulina brevifilum, Strain UTEX LB 985" /LENGTH=166 /DNA_ID=CAMNT_0015891195 /DNA_START=135 /DNA_END=635 /DNA_ORIENTATION=-